MTDFYCCPALYGCLHRRKRKKHISAREDKNNIFSVVSVSTYRLYLLYNLIERQKRPEGIIFQMLTSFNNIFAEQELVSTVAFHFPHFPKHIQNELGSFAIIL